jgi:hypothetical protein
MYMVRTQIAIIIVMSPPLGHGFIDGHNGTQSTQLSSTPATYKKRNLDPVFNSAIIRLLNTVIISKGPPAVVAGRPSVPADVLLQPEFRPGAPQEPEYVPHNVGCRRGHNLAAQVPLLRLPDDRRGGAGGRTTHWASRSSSWRATKAPAARSTGHWHRR